jgi:quercetin dioxygenase-like cupin family protein
MVDVVLLTRPDGNLAEPYANPNRFTAGVRIQWFGKQLGSEDFSAVAVFFEGGSRARPHRHQVEQLLYFISGEGVVAVDGEADQLIPEGSLVLLPANVPHMHGASDVGPACHISITRAPTETEWLSDVPTPWRRFIVDS